VQLYTHLQKSTNLQLHFLRKPVLQPLFEEVDNRIEQEQADFAAELDARVVEFEETYRAMHSLDLHSDQSANLDTHAPYMPYDGI
jgi:hypothetical protein